LFTICGQVKFVGITYKTKNIYMQHIENISFFFYEVVVSALQ